MDNGTRALVGLALLSRMNPVALLMAIPILILFGVALLMGWLFIKAVEVICRISRSRKPVSSAGAGHLESEASIPDIDVIRQLELEKNGPDQC
jgi:hypothetical protein